MYWYSFGRNDVYAWNGGRYKEKHMKTITAEEKQKIADLFSTHLLKIYFSSTRSHDNSDDERETDANYISDSYVYREVDVERDLYGLVMRNGEITGVAFYVKENNGDVEVEVFNFNNEPKNKMWLGYSASHSSSYTIVVGVQLVKKGENGAPESAKTVNFIQSKMYPSI